VVLTVVSTTPSNSHNSPQPAEMAAEAKPAATSVSAKNNLLHAEGIRIGKRVEVASAGAETETGKVVLPDLAVRSSAPRIWEHVPATPSWDHVQAVAVGRTPSTIEGSGERSGLLQSGLMGSGLAHHIGTWTGSSHAVLVQAPISGWSGVDTHRPPLHMLQPMLPPVR
jgi:hypothetical protein